MCKNFYAHLVGKVAKVFTDIKPESRVKRFIFRFIAVLEKWIRAGRQWMLNIYSDKPYKQLWIT
ncbi:MAG: hypothetical protein LBN29_01625 [Mediterranea sp.]|nr:hypothetical protein [Mediterranea sp.]